MSSVAGDGHIGIMSHLAVSIRDVAVLRGKISRRGWSALHGGALEPRLSIGRAYPQPDLYKHVDSPSTQVVLLYRKHPFQQFSSPILNQYLPPYLPYVPNLKMQLSSLALLVASLMATAVSAVSPTLNH